MCRPKHVEQLRNTGIINSTTRLHLVGSFYEIYITMHGSMNIKGCRKTIMKVRDIYSFAMNNADMGLLHPQRTYAIAWKYKN